MNKKISLIFLPFILIFALQTGTCFAKKFDDKEFKFIKWQNPAPRFTDLGLNMDEVRTIIGNGQLLISHKGQDIELWSGKQKTVKEFNDSRFVSGLVIFDKPRQEIIDIYFDFQKYSEIMSQYSEGDIIKQEGNNYLVKLKQIYHYLTFTLHTDFWYQYTVEDNGDFSILLLEGDVGASVSRIEFIALDENHTLVVNTLWIDVESARFTYRSVIKAVPEMKLTAAITGIATTTEQFQIFINNLDLSQPTDSTKLQNEPEIPIYTSGSMPITAIRRLSELGTLVFIHPLQWINSENGVKSVKFVSSITQLPCPVNQCKPISSDFTRYDEYFKIINGKVKNRDIQDGTETNWPFKVGIGLLSVKVDFTTHITASDWQNKISMPFKRASGDLDPLYGAWEWMDLEKKSTLFVFSVAIQIGDEASWVVKQATKVPNMEMTACILVGVNIVDEQVEWIKAQKVCNRGKKY